MSELKKDLRKYVEALTRGEDEAVRSLKTQNSIQTVTKLPGDASTRKYYRIQAVGGETLILMKMEPFSDQASQHPFLATQKIMASQGIDVPKVIDFDPPLGFVLLEDLGDVTLLRKLQEVSQTEVERHLYEQVIDSLVTLQVKATPRLNSSVKFPEMDAFKLRFDFEKLMWEVGFTIENFYELYLKRNLADKDRKTMIDQFGEICRLIEAQPTVFTHRDFHSRNIMAQGPRLVMIDFQDARMGPPQYDLASLLRDSYYQLDETQVRRLIEYYIAKLEALSGEKIQQAPFMRVFDLMGVQRNFKAIGSFASFLNKRNDAGYLKFIGNTFENIRRTLLRYPEYAALREVLFHYYYF
jgi:aminoglycoside/choline kinase family phosphotransferase